MLLFKLKRKAPSRCDGKMKAITDAGARLLARKDYDAIAMAEIAREAGCSVGALYARFPDKNAFLYHVIASTLRDASSAIAFTKNAKGQANYSTSELIQNIVAATVSEMSAPRVAGVIRAAIKLATVYPQAIKPFENYRASLSDQAVEALSRFPKIAPSQTHIGMQVVLATVTDALLQPEPGPMLAGRESMKSVLTDIFLGHLGLAESGRWARPKVSGKDKISSSKRSGQKTPMAETVQFDQNLRANRYPESQKPKLASRPHRSIKAIVPPQKPKVAANPQVLGKRAPPFNRKQRRK